MPETWYLVAVLATVFAITLALRALPFAALKPLRESELVRTLSVWMPAGILAILAASTLRGTIAAGDGDGHGVVLEAAIAVAVTVVVHLAFGRRTLLSVGLGTATFVALVNLL
ncbi:branched-chain amino acid transporter permease [Agromyces sp. NPDC004153]